MAHGHPCKQLERLVIAHRAGVIQHAAVPVGGVLAQAHVGHHDELGAALLDRTHGELDDAILIPCFAAVLVL